MNNKLIKIVVISTLFQMVVACLPTEKTYTVLEFKKDEALRVKVGEWCRESPGERRGLPNCENARHALQELQFDFGTRQRISRQSMEHVFHVSRSSRTAEKAAADDCG